MRQIRSEENYSDWVDQMYSAPTAERLTAMDGVLEELASTGAEGNALADSLGDPKEFEKPILLGYLHYSSIHQKPGTLTHLKFPHLTLALKHKRLPMIIVVSRNEPVVGKNIHIEAMKKSMGVLQALSYAHALPKMSVKEKGRLRELVIEGIRSYRKDNAKGRQWLSDYLRTNKDFSFLGFAINLPYINVDSSTGDTKSFWVHAWGTPQLLFSHKRLPAMMIVGPSVRLDENILGETNMTGFTG